MTRTGWRTPCSRMLAASSSRPASSMWRRGWYGLGTTRASGTSTTAAAPAARCGISDESPRPSALPVRSGFTVTRRPPRRRRCRARGAPGAPRRAPVGLRALGVRPVEGDRQAVARRLREADAARDDRAEHGVAEVAADLVRDLGGEVGAGVEHREHDARDREVRVEVVADEVDGGDQLRQALQRVVLALDGDQHGVRAGERVDGQEAQRRRAVHEDPVPGVALRA